MTVIPEAPVRSNARPRPLERLEAEIVTLATQLTAATATFIGLIGEFDAAEGWRDWGMRSTAHWLSWKCGIGMTAGRDQVRVARALRELPVMAAAFAEARLSYSKVRALTRFATADNEADLVAIAEVATAAQLEQLQAGMRRARTGEDVRHRHAARQIAYHWDDDGSLVGSFRLPPEDGARFLHSLDAARGRLQPLASEGEDAPAEAPPGQSGSMLAADALVAMAEHFLTDASAEASRDAAERFQLVIHTSAEALSRPDDAIDDGPPGCELADGTRLHPATARRLTCNCPTSTIIEDADGQPLHIGRRHRRVRGRLLRAVHARDRGRCRAPGCTERADEIHHIWHWANGGPTCLSNLISLCNAHHWLVHEGGFTILTRRPGSWALLSPAGVTVDPTPTPPPAPVPPLPHDPSVRDDAVSGHWDGSRLDVAYTTSCLTPPNSAEASVSAAGAGSASEGNSAEVRGVDVIAMNRWFDHLLAMQERAVACGDVIHLDDDE